MNIGSTVLATARRGGGSLVGLTERGLLGYLPGLVPRADRFVVPELIVPPHAAREAAGSRSP